MKHRKLGDGRDVVVHDNDNLLKRCGCEVTASGGKDRRKWLRCGHSWWLDFQHNGQPYRFPLNKEAKKSKGYDMGKDEAEALRDLYCSQIREGTFRARAPEPQQIDARTRFGDLAKWYLEQHAPFRDGEPRRLAG